MVMAQDDWTAKVNAWTTHQKLSKQSPRGWLALSSISSKKQPGKIWLLKISNSSYSILKLSTSYFQISGHRFNLPLWKKNNIPQLRWSGSTWELPRYPGAFSSWDTEESDHLRWRWSHAQMRNDRDETDGHESWQLSMTRKISERLVRPSPPVFLLIILLSSRPRLFATCSLHCWLSVPEHLISAMNLLTPHKLFHRTMQLQCRQLERLITMCCVFSSWLARLAQYRVWKLLDFREKMNYYQLAKTTNTITPTSRKEDHGVSHYLHCLKPPFVLFPLSRSPAILPPLRQHSFPWQTTVTW